MAHEFEPVTEGWSSDWTLDQYELDGIDAWSAFVFPLVVDEAGELLGFVFVKDPKFLDAFQKMASGHRQDDEDPLQTALREFEGEAGIKLTKRQMRFMGKQFVPHPKYDDHWKLLFVATLTIDDRDQMRGEVDGNEGEVPTFFPAKTFHDLVLGKFKLEHADTCEKFFPSQYKMLVEAKIIAPVPGA